MVQQRRHQPGAGAAQGVAQGDGSPARVDPRRVGPGLGQPGPDHRPERLVDLERVDLVQAEPGPLQHPGGRRDRSGQHGDRVDPGPGDRVHPGQRAPAVTGRHLAGRDEQRGGAVGDLRRVAGRHHAVLPEHRAQPGQRLEVGAAADALVGRHPGDRGQLGLDRAAVGGRGRPGVAAYGDLVDVGAGQPPALGHDLGADALRDQPVVVAGAHPGPEGQAGPLGDGAQHGHPAHRLDAAGDRDVVVPGHHARGGHVHRLLRGPALPVDGHPDHVLGPARREDGVAGDVDGLLTGLGDAAPHDVVDDGRVEPGPGGERLQDVRRQVHRVDARPARRRGAPPGCAPRRRPPRPEPVPRP